MDVRMTRGDAQTDPSDQPSDKQSRGSQRWTQLVVSWSDSPLAPMATNNGSPTSWARWTAIEGLVRLKALALVVVVVSCVSWLISWMPYGAIALGNFPDYVSPEDYDDLVSLGRPLWIVWVPALAILLAAIATLYFAVRGCAARLSEAERATVEAALAREREERRGHERDIQEFGPDGLTDTFAGASHAPRYLSFYLVALAVTVLFLLATVVEGDIYPWASWVGGVAAVVFSSVGLVLLAGIAVCFGLYAALYWVRGIRWWRYVAAHGLVGVALERAEDTSTSEDPKAVHSGLSPGTGAGAVSTAGDSSPLPVAARAAHGVGRRTRHRRRRHRRLGRRGR
jgi:hypothetical protein